VLAGRGGHAILTFPMAHKRPRSTGITNAVLLQHLQGMRSALEGRMGNMEGRMDKMERGMNGMEGRMGGFETRMGGLTTRMGGLETHMGGLTTRIGGLETHMGGLTTRIGGLEHLVKDGFAEMHERFKRVDDALQRIYTHRVNMLGRIERLEETVGIA